MLWVRPSSSTEPDIFTRSNNIPVSCFPGANIPISLGLVNVSLPVLSIVYLLGYRYAVLTNSIKLL